MYDTDSDCVFRRPVKGNFPFLGIESAKIALLDEWRFDETVVPISDQLLWYEGKPLPTARPQTGRNAASGHFLYKGTAPVFVTTKLDAVTDVSRLATQAPSGEHSMLLRRLSLYHFSQSIPKPPGGIVPCPRCFATGVQAKAQEWRNGQ